MFKIGQTVIVSPEIANAGVGTIVTPKGKRLGNCIGKIKEVSEKYSAATLDIPGGETWIPFEFLSATSDETQHFVCYERYHHSGFCPEGFEKKLADVHGSIATACYVVDALLICTEDSDGVVYDAEGKRVAERPPKGAWVIKSDAEEAVDCFV